jgi:AcrR family transcriptional regulator
MADAGLTNGAFYVHFESKEVLVREALGCALALQRDKLSADSGQRRDLESVVRSYLNEAHVAEPNVGCPSAALLPEIGRQPLPTRKEYEAGLVQYLKVLASFLPDPGSPAAMRRAMAIFGCMVGALQLARAVADPTLAKSLLEGGVAAAVGLAKLPM